MTEDPILICQAENIDAIIEVTGAIEFGAHVVMKAIEHVTARLRAAAALDRAIRERIGDAGLDQLYKVLEAVGEVSRGKAEFDPANVYRARNLW